MKSPPQIRGDLYNAVKKIALLADMPRNRTNDVAHNGPVESPDISGGHAAAFHRIRLTARDIWRLEHKGGYKP